MHTFQYTHPKQIDFTDDIPIKNNAGEIVAISKRIYDNPLKKTMDRLFDYRYFLKYHIYNPSGDLLFTVKKISRKGRLWYEGHDTTNNKQYIISYENWRLGVPELYITDGNKKIQLNKEMEDWSQFIFDNEVIAQWKADFVNDQFQMTFTIDEKSPIQNVAVFIGICQAALFVGA
ncbi:hypothetical protein SAMN05880501_10826 [Ureibacillus xyleni]|uniref:Tubby C-terminal domain-containing protein n=1 Tax=Ureibacillus xyleni TaxID=614648 RepID=A0A285T1C7_9BACL|nr:hypothetical protein [Ureibacillus xyleni]SOC15049.1 hypothetical protein SAMN05880501_10826 [Ureibacillus xyleni]